MLFKGTAFFKQYKISKQTMKCIHNDLVFFFISESVHIPKAIDHESKARITAPQHVHQTVCFLLKGKPLHLKGSSRMVNTQAMGSERSAKQVRGYLCSLQRKGWPLRYRNPKPKLVRVVFWQKSTQFSV